MHFSAHSLGVSISARSFRRVSFCAVLGLSPRVFPELCHDDLLNVRVWRIGDHMLHVLLRAFAHIRTHTPSQLARPLSCYDRICVASSGVIIIAACAHVSSAGSLTHCKLPCDRHRNTRKLQAWIRRRVESCGATFIANDADSGNTEQPTRRSLRCERQCSMCAHGKRRIADASQVAVRPLSQTHCQRIYTFR